MDKPTGNQGPSTDKDNKPVIDPTANVQALSEASNLRQDDLRDALITHILAIVAAEARRQDDLRHAESRRLDEQAALRAEFNDKLATAESKRIDAIRAVDVNAVAVASQRAADQATVLANQVVQSAEALRTLVASTAATVATSQQQLATTLSARLTTLEQAGYQQQGKTSRDDPAMVELVQEMRNLRAARDTSGGERRGMSLSAQLIVGGFGFLLTLMSIGGVLVAVLRK